MPAYVYVISTGNGHLVRACDGELSAAIAELDKALGVPTMLLWAEAVKDMEMAELLVPLIEALDDTRYGALLAGEDEARTLLVVPPPSPPSS
ncbi:hypothetical protein sos41_35010 [Alphaproteobacteria bacterium SO-S41]|nr:hypothetical protein sos41_35010 [Alphaproteobacteria bacterium SO-S41]